MNRWQHNPNRYLFNNHGWWWMKYSPYDPVYTDRVNINLKTRDLEEARQRRDLELVKFMRGSLKGLAA